MKASARLGCVSPALLFYSAAAAAAAPILNPRRSKNKLQQRVSSNNVSVSECTITVVRPRQQCTICYASRHCQKDDSLSSLVQLCFSRQLLEVCGPLQWSVSDLLFWFYVFGFHLKRQRMCKYKHFFEISSWGRTGLWWTALGFKKSGPRNEKNGSGTTDESYSQSLQCLSRTSEWATCDLGTTLARKSISFPWTLRL